MNGWDRWRAVVLAVAVVMVTAVGGCGETEPEGPLTFAEYPPLEIDIAGIDAKRPYNAILTTSLGRMTFNLLSNEAPLAVNSFLFLANRGYYDGITFHRVIAGMLAETGDATATGRGNAGYTFEIEPPQRPYARGVLAMANDGAPNSNGSRFFIMFGDMTVSNDPPANYTVFGVMKEDHKPSERTLAAIEAIPVGPGPNGELSHPLEELTLVEVQAISGCLPTHAYGPCF